MESHVITVGLEFADGLNPAGFTCEVYRGDKQECRDLLSRMACVSHDTRQIASAYITCGTIREWEDFLRH